MAVPTPNRRAAPESAGLHPPVAQLPCFRNSHSLATILPRNCGLVVLSNRQSSWKDAVSGEIALVSDDSVDFVL
jgi:hypothetical protein